MNTYSFKNISLAFVLSGLLLMVLSIFEILIGSAQIYFYASFGLMTFGSLLYFWIQYANSLPGIKNNGIWFHPLTARGLWGWLLGISLTLFYIFLYWFPEILGYNPSGSSGIVAFFDPLSIALNGKPATQWFLYLSLIHI